MIPALTLIVRLLHQLQEAEIPFMVGGSFASSAWGIPRQSLNLDVEVRVDGSHVDRLYELTHTDYLGSISQIHEALESREHFRSFQILHIEETFKIDFFLAEDDPYTSSAFARAIAFELAPGHAFPFKSPEDILVTKLRWFQLGNRVSDKQWNDIVQVLEVQHGKLDGGYLEFWCDHFGVLDLLFQAQMQIIGSD